MGAKTSLRIILDASCGSLVTPLELLGHLVTVVEVNDLDKTFAHDLYLGPKFARLTPGMVEAAKADKDGLTPLAKLVIAGACRVKRDLARSEKPEKVRKPRDKKETHG